jgi:hypothetical protein
MKLMTVFAVLLSLAAGTGVARAQWSHEDDTRAWRHEGRGYDRGVSRDPLARAAHQLSEEAAHVAHFLRAAEPRGRLTDDAIAFANSAALFRQLVERGAPRQVLAREYQSMQREMRSFAGAIDYGRYARFRGGDHFDRDVARLMSSFRNAEQLVRYELGGARRGRGYYDRPGYDRPGYDRPGYDRPGYDRPGYGRAIQSRAAVSAVRPRGAYRASPTRPQLEVRVGF